MRRSTLVPAGLITNVLKAVLAVGLSVGLTTGCAAGTPGAGPDDADPANPADRADRSDGTGTGFAEVLAGPAPTADYAWYPETVSAALPSVRYADGGEAHASELAAVGRFTSWAAGEPGHPSMEEIDLTFAVDEVVESLGDLTMLEGTTVTVHVAVDGSADSDTDTDRMAEELLALDDVVLFLNHVGPEPWPPPEWVVVFDNTFLGDVHDDGTITWPVAEAIAANNPADSHPEADVTTLDELRAAAGAASEAAATAG
ncbi:hypothetical protein GCM10010413_32300 [Promicromonospora sukumoe]|uniref:Lipoprotein n=1 Tax=Promicromonospora sukumoe TaxID=88382 RepID=A0A7W3J8B5_9MICO|nr:hypothetical protein [Promicromonospora sukumoe]MBA8807984.1 hypothetical protein [Promicromonospora sukumoe]